MGTQLLPQKRWHSPQFLAHVYCGKMARWIKMPLGTEVGLGPDDIALDGGLLPLQKRGLGPQFSAHHADILAPSDLPPPEGSEF